VVWVIETWGLCKARLVKDIALETPEGGPTELDGENSEQYGARLAKDLQVLPRCVMAVLSITAECLMAGCGTEACHGFGKETSSD
jgi:hypothetical protein